MEPSPIIADPNGPGQIERSVQHSRVIDAVDRLRRGEMIVVTDDDDRENEGDLICAASLCTPEMMAFIIRHTSGIVCAPISEEAAKRLHLAPMVARNDAPLATAFSVSIDCSHGLTTGISATERCNTVRALANPNMGAHDFARPGHVFPLVARNGGVLMRSGHTEAAVDMCRLAGLPDIGVISELANDDGTVMKGEEIEAFSREHELAKISVADLISWRQANEQLVHCVETFTANSKIGPLAVRVYLTPFDSVRHFVFIYGDIDAKESVRVRLHRSNVIDDVLGGGERFREALDRIKEAGRGVLVYLRDDAAGVRSRASLDLTDSESRRNRAWMDIGIGAQILRDMGIQSIEMLSTKEMSYTGIGGFGITISKTEIIS